MINYKIEERLCGNPPEILKVIAEDLIIQDLKYKFAAILNTNFDAVKRYCQRFNKIKQFYDEDMKFDENIIRDNKRCDLFRKWCIRYENEMDIIDKTVDYQPLGIFAVQLGRFKAIVKDASKAKKNVIEVVMPG